MRLLLLLSAVALLAACGGTRRADPQTATGSNGCTGVTAPAEKQRNEPKPATALDPSKTYDVTLHTNCGCFTFRLAVATSPATTASFVSLTRKGYFDKTVFHRIVPGFVIQGGDPTGTGTSGPGYTTVDRPPASTSYTHGLVAMAKTQAEAAGTSGSQFFVVTAQDAQLPPDYAVLGKVTKGLAVVDAIGKLGDPSTQQPTETVEIESATVTVH
jgi:cyclophilin family peptidyl-prolyl cis-trans isomerase